MDKDKLLNDIYYLMDLYIKESYLIHLETHNYMFDKNNIDKSTLESHIKDYVKLKNKVFNIFQKISLICPDSYQEKVDDMFLNLNCNATKKVDEIENYIIPYTSIINNPSASNDDVISHIINKTINGGYTLDECKYYINQANDFLIKKSKF